MVDRAFYLNLHRILGNEAPLRFDCGRLCGAACCQVSPELPGMYLFPGEEALYAGLDGFTADWADLPGYGSVRLLSCHGECDRALRPLACHVFPLAPKIKSGAVTTRLDPRGRAVCPLCRQGAGGLSGGFTAAVEQAFQLLMTRPDACAFLAALSQYLDEFEDQRL